MILHVMTRKAVIYLSSRAEVSGFPILLGVCATLVTITLTVPVELLVIVGVLLKPSRWAAIGLSAALGSSVASIGLYLAFHHLGWSLLLGRYPDIAASRFWADLTRWLSDYGVVVLFVLMAAPLPLPKTPALALVAIYRIPIHEVILAIAFGKLLKYTGYAYTVSRFPKHFTRWYAALFDRNHDVPQAGTNDSVTLTALRRTEAWWSGRPFQLRR